MQAVIFENQLGKQHVTKLFKNLQEAEAEELDIDSAAKEVAEMLKNYRCKKVPAPLHTSGIGNRTEDFDGNGDNSEEDDIEIDDDDDSEEGNDCDGNNNRINSNIHIQNKVVLCNQMAFIRNQMKSPCLDQCCKRKAKIPTTKKKRNDEMLKSYVYEQTIMELEVRDISI